MRRLLPLAAALVSGAATALALPLVIPFLSIRQVDPGGRLEVVAWLSLVPAFLALRGCRGAWRAALLGLVAGLAYFFAAIYWVSHAMTSFGGLSLPLALLALTLLVLYMAAHWALAFGVAARVRARLGWPLWAILPPAWAATELLRNYLFSGFPWADLGYTQARTLPVAQLASVAGPYGIAALVVLVNAALAEVAAALAGRRRPPLLPPGIAAGALALALAYGAAHLASVRAELAAAPAILAGVVQPNIDQSTRNARRSNEEYILERLVGPTVEADRAGADLVVWPEASYPFDVPPGLRSLDVRGAGVPRLARAHLLAGAPTLEWRAGADGKRVPQVGNSLFLLGPDLKVLGDYQKLHLVPFGEYVPEAVLTLLPFVKQIVPSMAAVTPGRRHAVLELGAAGTAGPVRLAPLICYDAIFPEIVRAFDRKSPPPDLLVNATNDAWYGYSSGPYQFLAIVQLRAIEARRTVLRSALAGVSAVILPTGELLPGAIEVGPVDPERQPEGDEPARLLLARAPLLRGRTLYTSIGDLFAFGCALAAAGALLAAALPWPRRRPAAAGPRAHARAHGRS
jgi:apolipoprotein N-acyltransferase